MNERARLVSLIKTKIESSLVRGDTRRVRRMRHERCQPIHDRPPRPDREGKDHEREQADERSGKCVKKEGHPESSHASLRYRYEVRNAADYFDDIADVKSRR